MLLIIVKSLSLGFECSCLATNYISFRAKIKRRGGYPDLLVVSTLDVPLLSLQFADLGSELFRNIDSLSEFGFGTGLFSVEIIYSRLCSAEGRNEAIILLGKIGDGLIFVLDDDEKLV